MNWFKQNWTRIATVLLLAAIYYMLFFGDDSETQNKNGLKFDLNITELSYALPTYTHMCIPNTKQICSSDGNCSPVKPTVFVLYDQNSSRVYRCDDKPCDSYDVNVGESGLFTILQPINNPDYEVKISYNNDYVETAGLGLDRHITHGTCILK